ncbi:hypothetical protein STCU_11017 [Strigomonas culicis]|uniref:Uncharacterized protein n=1 Tax=Strigomonas culicis TaxID=28005 RepID=S9TK77_9TRYP|nr:hypothetical protein STCU_11017 [Strigomonas culicis]|eukprot:EPY16753.1 hypothetical protein STCU_11017 [Strigomonas culicis]
MRVKRLTEKQRLPSSVFRRRGSLGEGGNVADLGIAMAFVIMWNAIDAIGDMRSMQARSLRARLRWRFVRTLVRTGEATYILYHATQVGDKMSAITVSSVPGLFMAPELNIVGPQKPVPVPLRPVPYTLPEHSQQRARFTEVSKSGMVVYHNIPRK